MRGRAPLLTGRLRDCGGVAVLAVDVVPLDGQVQNGRCCICSRFVALEALYLTHMGVMPGVVCLAVLLRRFLWHAGSQKIVHCVIQYTDKTNTNSLRLVDSLPHTTPVPKRFLSHIPTKARPSSPLAHAGSAGLALVAKGLSQFALEIGGYCSWTGTAHP